MTTKRGLGNALLYVIVVVGVIVGAQFVLNDALGSSPFYVVVSKSMLPTLDVGDIVVVRGVDFGSVHVNDVIIYNTPRPGGGCGSLVVVHRVIGISADRGLITQGDNRATNPFPDEPNQWPYIHAECLRGVVVLVVPYVGRISMLFPPPTNYILVVLILVAIFVTELRRGDKGEEKANTGDEPKPSI